MFFIFKIFPDWIWWLVLIAGFFGYFLSHLIPVKIYALLSKTLSGILVAVGIFVLGMLYCDNTWKAAAADLQQKVAELEVKSQEANTVIKDRLVTRTQIIKVRGEDTVKYIDREVAKTDLGCVISPEFTQAHNRAAEPLK
jgi:hypothetical protein